jgi:hypothetical protein
MNKKILKSSEETSNRRKTLQEAIYGKLIANIMLKGEKLTMFPLKSVTKWCSLSLLLLVEY